MAPALRPDRSIVHLSVCQFQVRRCATFQVKITILRTGAVLISLDSNTQREKTSLLNVTRALHSHSQLKAPRPVLSGSSQPIHFYLYLRHYYNSLGILFCNVIDIHKWKTFFALKNIRPGFDPTTSGEAVQGANHQTIQTDCLEICWM